MTDVGFSDLSALFLNCSLKRDPSESHTMRLVQRAAGIMEAEGVAVEVVHALDHRIPFGMDKDMTEHSAPVDDWPMIQDRIEAADILVVGSPIWLGAKSSVATLAIERMYANSAETNDRGQYVYYGKTAGCVVTGNEDGVKAVARDVLYALQHIGYVIPPGADCGWLGSIGPGPSYGDEIDGQTTPAGYDSEFTNKNCTVMAWNLMHTARMLRDRGGFPTEGNTVGEWSHVTNAADQNPEYRS
ncbi:MAG: NAD(P)H-dependent oxidoreductase [Acidimicrobiales bacterium]